MDDSPMDPERIAALIDGRLDGPARAELLARLAEYDAEFEVFADAAAVTREMEDETTEERDEPPTPLPTRRWPRWPMLALAAALAAVAIGVGTWTSLRSAPAGPVAFVDRLADDGAGFPDGWDARPWSRTRSAADELPLDARSVRLGVRLVDLEVAVRADDAAAARLADEVASLLDGIPAAGPIAARYREAADAPAAERDALLDDGYDAVAEVADADHLALGAWAEAARLAAARGDAAFFRSGASRDGLEDAASLSTLSASAREAVGRIDAALDADAPDWTAVGDDLVRLLRAAGS